MFAGYGSGKDPAIEVWSFQEAITTGKIDHYSLLVPGGADEILRLALSFDGKLLAAGSQSGDTYIYDISSNDQASLIKTILLPDNFYQLQLPSSAVAASPTDSTLAVAYGPFEDGGAVFLYNFNDGKKLRTISASHIENLAVSPDGKLLAVASTDGQVALWSLVKGTGVRDYGVSGSGVNDVAFSPDGQRLVAGFVSGELTMFNTYRRETIWSVELNDFSCSGIAFSQKGD